MQIYLTKNNVNGLIYIGKDKHSRKTYLGSGKLFKQALAKYGRENFSKTVLFETQDWDELNTMEKHYIKHYNSQDRNIGYNIADGGINTVMYGEDNPQYGKPGFNTGNKYSDATKEIMRQNNLGSNNPMWGKRGELHPLHGKTLSAEHRAKISESLRNRYK